MTLNHQAFASVSWDSANGSLPCTVDISVHYDVSAGDKKGRPTNTSKSFYNHFDKFNVTITKVFSFQSHYADVVNMGSYIL